MPKVHYIQTAFNAGVLDPRLAARLDIRQYFQGMSQGDNVVCLPMGGIRRRPGLKFIDRAVRPLMVNQPDSSTAPEGGTATNATTNANSLDRDTLLETTGNVGTTDPYVVVRVDLGADFDETVMVDAFDIKATGGSTDEFRIQYSTDDSTWVNFGAAFDVVDTRERDYRRRAANLEPVSARYWRIAKIGGSDMGSVTISLSGFRIWRESTGNSGSCRMIPFEFNTEQTYLLAFTRENVAVYRDGEHIADVYHPFFVVGSDIINDLDYAQSADTMILAHEEIPPQALQRRAVPGDKTIETHWEMRPVAFTNTPQVDFNDDDSPAVTAEVQTLTFNTASWDQGDQFQIEVEGSVTPNITWQGTSTTETAENIRRELQKLPTIIGETGITVAESGGVYTVTFGGASANDYGLMGAFPTSAADAATITVARDTAGSSRREDAWSDTRGYPRSVTFFGGRLWFGGSRDLPTSFWASTAFDLFDFQTREGLADEAIFNTLLSERLNAIVSIYGARDLVMFTTGGEFRFPSEILTPENAVPRNQTQYGVAQIRPVNIDGAVLFIQRTRKVLRDFVFSLEEDAYLAAPLSALSPFLLNGVIAMSGWQGSGDDDANYVFLVNGDGTVACLNTLRSQDVAAWTRWTTNGKFKATAVVDQAIYFGVERVTDRIVSGTAQNDIYIEQAQDDYYTDASVQATLDPASDTVTGLDHLDGQECRVKLDGNVLTNRTPSGGSITMEQEGEAVEVGLNFDVTVRPMPLNNDFGNGENFLRNKRLVEARLYLYQSLGVRFNGKRVPDRRMDSSQLDSSPSVVTGTVSIKDTSNWSRDPLTPAIEVLDPVPFTLLGMDLHVETS